MEIEELVGDFNSVEMSNEKLLRLEASEIEKLQVEIANLLYLNQTLAFAEYSDDLQRELLEHMSDPFDSLAKSFTFILKRKVAINKIRYALFVIVRPAVLLLALFFELFAVAMLFHLSCTRNGISSGAEALSNVYLLLHILATVIENILFHGLELLSYAIGVGHPATAFKLLCNLWWLSFKVVHAFPLWILLPASFGAGMPFPIILLVF